MLNDVFNVFGIDLYRFSVAKSHEVQYSSIFNKEQRCRVNMDQPDQRCTTSRRIGQTWSEVGEVGHRISCTMQLLQLVEIC